VDLGKLDTDWVRNPFENLQILTGKKMHAIACLMLGYVALVGIEQGHVTRMELDFVFLSLAVLMCVIFGYGAPGTSTLRSCTLFLKPSPNTWCLIRTIT
jgi:hypothetical protein